MIYYKSKAGDVYAYENGQERKERSAPELVEMSAAELR